MMPVTTASRAKSMTAGRMTALMSTTPLGQARHYERQVNELNPGEGQQDPPDPVEQQVAAQEHRRSEGPIFDTLQRQRNEEHNDHGIEDHGSKDGRERAC